MAAIKQFFNNNPVFTWEDFSSELGKERSRETLRTQIKYYVNTNKIGQIKSGLYYVKKTETTNTIPDKYLVASKLTEDSVLGFHSAFELLGYGHSISSRIYFLTSTYVRKIKYQAIEYKPVSVPKSLRKQSHQDFGTVKVERLGKKIKITGKERTIVDVLNRPAYAGGVEEMMHCIDKIPYIQFDVLFKYLQLRKKKILFAKAGFLLEQFRKEWFVEEEWLQSLEKNLPESPTYFFQNEKGTLFDRWNIIVPEYLVQNSWEEM